MKKLRRFKKMSKKEEDGFVVYTYSNTIYDLIIKVKDKVATYSAIKSKELEGEKYLPELLITQNPDSHLIESIQINTTSFGYLPTDDLITMLNYYDLALDVVEEIEDLEHFFNTYELK